jgi:hypothetical protein
VEQNIKSTFKKSGANFPFWKKGKTKRNVFVSTFYKSWFGSTFSKGGFLKVDF